MAELTIEHWDDLHPRWAELVQIAADEQQEEWFSAQFEWHRSSHVLVTLQAGVICGFLRFTTQVIGEDAGCDPVMLNGKPLIEAKVLAFAVVARFRNQGIGHALQTEALHSAVKLRCYQLRSHSSGKNEANHHLKLSMGFGIQPIMRGDDKRGAYFVMPLYNLWNNPQVEIVRLLPAEWQAYKALRLAALQEAPYAFAAAYAENLTRPDSHWHARLEEAQAGRSVLLFARAGDRLVGMVGAFPSEDDPEAGVVISVYVAPAFRRQGIARRLMEAVLDDLKQRGFHKAVLLVNAEPPAAFELYRGVGFRITGDVSGQAGDGNVHHGYRMEKSLVD